MNRGFVTRWNHSAALSRKRRRAFGEEMLLTRVALLVTLVALAGIAADTAFLAWRTGDGLGWPAVVELLAGRSLIAFFVLSALVYQLTRLGYLARSAMHREPPGDLLALEADNACHSLSILVPSYAEEPGVIRRTLLAAALQRWPDRRVVLLIDDPSAPAEPAAAARLAAARALPGDVAALLAGSRARYERELQHFQERSPSGSMPAEIERLADLWRSAADWLDSLARTEFERGPRDHYDRFFVERILKASARAHRKHAAGLIRSRTGAPPDLAGEYRRLAALFRVEISSFERKRYANLSHESNKAMNLNAYLSLMGRAFREEVSSEGRLLVPAADDSASIRIPGADFVIVLDADSVILPDYSTRLIHFMNRRGNERVAVAQTPYASVPGAPGALERIAGAGTDVQLMSHQGSSLFGAGSWVGASAMVRRAALDDIVIHAEERGHPVAVYVRDRTLNEDTDTTVALIRKGWRVENYPERLARSATPPDFGALLIQRRRWATGGLIILPDLARYVLGRPTPARLREGIIRAQYILAAPVGSLALLVMIVLPFEPAAVWTPWCLPALAAYLFCYGRDLAHNGGRAADLPRAVALNAMLLPINLAGAFNSIGQIATGRKIPFQRTPKVGGRTAAPPLHVAAQLGFMVFLAAQIPAMAARGEWMGSSFFAIQAAAFAYAIQVYIGWEAVVEDLLVGQRRRAREWMARMRERFPGLVSGVQREK